MAYRCNRCARQTQEAGDNTNCITYLEKPKAAPILTAFFLTSILKTHRWPGEPWGAGLNLEAGQIRIKHQMKFKFVKVKCDTWQIIKALVPHGMQMEIGKKSPCRNNTEKKTRRSFSFGLSSSCCVPFAPGFAKFTYISLFRPWFCSWCLLHAFGRSACRSRKSFASTRSMAKTGFVWEISPFLVFPKLWRQNHDKQGGLTCRLFEHLQGAMRPQYREGYKLRYRLSRKTPLWSSMFLILLTGPEHWPVAVGENLARSWDENLARAPHKSFDTSTFNNYMAPARSSRKERGLHQDLHMMF